MRQSWMLVTAISFSCILQAASGDEKNDNAAAAKKLIESRSVRASVKAETAILNATESEVYLLLSEAIRSLGWENEFLDRDNDLIKFEKDFPEFKDLFQATGLLTLSENMAILESQYSDPLATESKWTSAKRVLKYLGVISGSITGGAAIGAYPGLSILAAGGDTAGLAGGLLIMFGGLGGAIIGGVYGIANVAVQIVRSPFDLIRVFSFRRGRISFKDRILESDLDNTSEQIYCTKLGSSELSLSIAPAEGGMLRGSWGIEPLSKAEGFASQASPAVLLSRCAREMRDKMGIEKLNPKEVVVKVKGAKKKLASTIIYYSKFLDNKGRAIRLTSYFSK